MKGNVCCTCCVCGLNDLIVNTFSFNEKSISYCPNCMRQAILDDSLKRTLENDVTLTDDITGKSGAVLLVSGNETYTLEKETMLRLVSYTLKPEEYAALFKKYGNAYMLHEDFYDANGIALQPVK